ncbi:MAG TPA: ABC transporter permease [Lachnospiraceae bacterium]|nr:ABC transporter permease [Lachnospiraceae bacterium]
MPFVLIKNNLKLMLRSKWILVIMILLPLVTIALLSNAFKEMLDTTYEMKDFQVGYRISSDNTFGNMIPELEKICKENHIILQEYPNGDITNLLKSKTVAVIVDITDDTYTIYQSNDKAKEAAIVESIFTSFFYQVSQSRNALSYQAQAGSVQSPSTEVVSVTAMQLDTEPVPSSTDYYGIIYIVYFAWCGMVSLVAVITSERASAIPRRMKVSHLTKWKYYFGKFIPCSIAIFLEVGIAWLLSVVLFGIHWGNIGASILIVFLISMAATAFGMVLYQLFNNVAISIVFAFIITWVAGFLGGSFQSYMYAHLPERLVSLSPIYFINRTLVEYSTKGYSDYTGKCFAWLLGIIIVFGGVGILLMNRKLEEQ